MVSARQLIEDFLNSVARTPAGAYELKRFNRIFKFEITGRSPFCVYFEDGRFKVSDRIPKEEEIHISVHTDEATLQSLLTGKIDAADAWVNADQYNSSFITVGVDLPATAWFIRLIRLYAGGTDFVPSLRKEYKFPPQVGVKS